MKKALFTTNNDFSVNYFIKNGWIIHVYDQLRMTDDYDVVYFRDPFNDKDLLLEKEQINSLIHKFDNSKSIDSIRSYDDMINIEDKWNQSLLYGDCMPKTFLPSTTQFIPGKFIAKKRISQRAKDVLFEVDHPLDDNWIYQELLDIREELRIYAVFGKVIPQATIKTSKKTGKVKVVGGRALNDQELKFAKKITQKSDLDFIGIDVAILENGELKAIEINRSPQFKRFAELYGENYFSDLLEI